MLTIKEPLTVEDLEVPVPEQHRAMAEHPIPHRMLVEALEEQAKNRGWKLWGARFHLNNFFFPASQLTASFDVKLPVQPPPNATFSLGLINTNASGLTLRLLAGLRFLNTDAGVPFFEYDLGRRTVNFNLENQISEAFDKYLNDAKGMVKIIHRLEQHHISQEELNALLANASRGGLMPWSRSGLVDKAFREAENKTAWTLLQRFAETAKQNPPHKQLRQVLRFYQLLQERGA